MIKLQLNTQSLELLTQIAISLNQEIVLAEAAEAARIAAEQAQAEAASEDTFLANQLSRSNRQLIKEGLSPFTLDSGHAGKRKTYNIHHVIPIHAGGEVYDMDNMRIVTPKLHLQIHGKKETHQ